MGSSLGIDAAAVLKLGRLARLRLSAEEAALFAPQLERVLDHVRGLSAVDVQGLEPLFHPGLELEAAAGLSPGVRDDLPTPSQPGLVELAAESVQGSFKVPPIV